MPKTSEEFKPKQYEEENKKNEVDFDDGSEPKESTFQKVRVEEGEYTGKWTLFQTKEMRVWGTTDGRKETKLIATIKLDKEEKEIPYYMTTKVTKSTDPNFNNSSLWNFLERYQTIEEYKRLPEPRTYEQLIKFLDKHILGKKARVIVGTVNEGKEDDQGNSKEYSKVDKILKDK